MISMLFGLGDRSPKYFPEDDFSVVLDEDNIIAIVSDDSMSCIITEDKIEITLED